MAPARGTPNSLVSSPLYCCRCTTSPNYLAHFSEPIYHNSDSGVYQGGSLGWSSNATSDLVFSFCGILFSACAILVIHFARAVVSCDASFSSTLTSCDSLASCTIFVILSTKAITICTISTKMFTVYNNLQREIHNSESQLLHSKLQAKKFFLDSTYLWV